VDWWEGYFHTDKMITERFTRNGDLLLQLHGHRSGRADGAVDLDYLRAAAEPEPRGRMSARVRRARSRPAADPALRGLTDSQLTDLRIYEFSNLNDHLKVTSLRHINSGCSAQRN
jgi:hypothetical protein